MVLGKEDRIRLLLQHGDKLLAKSLVANEDETGEYYLESKKMYEAARKLREVK